MMHKRFIATLALAAAGLAAGADAQPLTVSANITTDTVWGDTLPLESEIVLDGAIFVKSGATLTILPGVIVRGNPRSAAVLGGSTIGTPGALIVTQDGRLIAEGSASSPITMTTAAVDNNADGEPDDLDASGFLDAYPGFDPADCPGACALPGLGLYYDDDPNGVPLSPLSPAGLANVQLWGGVAILGRAPTNLADEAGVGYGQATVEGLTVPGFPTADALYGGLLPHDNSGSLRYVEIRHAGDEIGSGNELNGLTLAGVGDGTTLENVSIYCNFDDGIEWFGGTVNGKNLAVFYAGDDSFDIDQGYTGVNQYLFGVLPTFNAESPVLGGPFGSASGDKAGEFDGDDAGPDPTFPDNGNIRVSESLIDLDVTPWPLSNPAMFNMTLISSTHPGNPATSPASVNNGIQFRHGFAGDVFNSIIVATSTDAAFEVDSGIGEAIAGFDATDNATGGLIRVVSTTAGSDTAAIAGDAIDVRDNGDSLAALLGGGANINAGGTWDGLVQQNTSISPKGSATAGKLDASVLHTGEWDPRPAGDTGTLAGTAGYTPGVAPVTFRGAFDRTAPTLWTTGWTAVNIGGVLAD